jgi:hypothetical protein
VLDGGDDCVFVGDKSRFEQMMESLSEAFNEEDAKTEPETIDADEQETAVDQEVRTQTDDIQSQEMPIEDNNTSDSPATNENRPLTTAPKAASTPDELITQGVSFLSGLAQTLQSPEATERLVNTLVETNEQTGESTLRIPVPDKQTVSSLLTLVGKLFGGK